MSRIIVHRVPVLKDNYSYLIEDTSDKTCVVLDPGESGPVIEAIEQRGLKPVAIWNTHHHDDHIAGNGGVLERFPGLPVVGAEGDRGRVPELTEFVKPGSPLAFGGDSVEVLFVPGHTRGHIAFYFPSGHLFSGDLLFGYSCGAVFEGTLEQMYESVSQLLPLPDSTLVYCGHEYTFNSRKWAEAVEPDNAAIKQRIADQTETPTVPLHLGQEKATNPFLRVDQPAVQAYTGKTAPAEVFGELRTMKNNFKA